MPARRIAGGLDMRFLHASPEHLREGGFIGPPVSAILPSAGRLPFQRWLRVVVLYVFTCGPFDRGLAPHLQRAHAGRTPAGPGDALQRA